MTVPTRDNGKLPEPHFSCYGCWATIREPSYAADDDYWESPVTIEANPLVIKVPRSDRYPEGKACICVGCTEQSRYKSLSVTRLHEAKNRPFEKALMARYVSMMTEPQRNPTDRTWAEPEAEQADISHQQKDPVLATV